MGGPGFSLPGPLSSGAWRGIPPFIASRLVYPLFFPGISGLPRARPHIVCAAAEPRLFSRKPNQTSKFSAFPAFAPLPLRVEPVTRPIAPPRRHGLGGRFTAQVGRDQQERVRIQVSSRTGALLRQCAAMSAEHGRPDSVYIVRVQSNRRAGSSLGMSAIRKELDSGFTPAAGRQKPCCRLAVPIETLAWLPEFGLLRE